MRTRSLLILAAATLVLVAIAVGLAATGPRAVTRAANGERVLAGLAAHLDDVGSVSLTRSDLKATFNRQGDSWLVAEKSDYPASAGKVRQLVIELADMTLVESKTDQPNLYPRLEVEDPGKGKSSLVELKDKAGKPMGSLIVGKKRYDRLGAGTDGVYVRKPGDPLSWLARGSLDLSGEMLMWLDRRIANVPDKRIASLSVTQPDGSKLTISRPNAEAKLVVEDAPADAKYKSTSAVNEPATALDGLDLIDVKTAADLPVAQTGITAAEYETFDGLTITVRLVEKDGASWISIAASGTGPAELEAKQINDKAGKWSFSIAPYKANMMKSKLSDLLEPPKAS